MTDVTDHAASAEDRRSARRSLWRLIRDMVALLGPRQRRRFAAVGVLSAINATLEAFGAVLILALIASLADQAESSGGVARAIGRIFHTTNQRDTTVVLGVVTLVFYVVKNASSVLEVYLQQRTVQQAAAEASTSVLRRYMGVPTVEHAQQSSGNILRDASASTETVFRQSMLALLSMITESLSAVALLVVLVAVAPTITPWVVLALLVMVMGIYRGLHRRMTGWGRDAQHLTRRTLQHLQESFSAFREARVLGVEDEFVGRFQADRRQLARAYSRSGTASQAPRMILETAFIVVMVLAILVLTISNQQGTSIKILGLYSYAGLRLMPASNRFLASLANLRFGEEAVQIVQRALALPQESQGEDLPEVSRLETGIRFEGVSFVYPGSDEPAIRDLDVVIRRGESVGVVGRSGGGKSTFADLLVGLIGPTSGRVTVDGVDISGSLRWWRRHVGYVSQSVFLLDDSIRANVAFGVPPDLIDDVQVARVLDEAQLTEFVAALPDGVASEVGERGVRLSGGQRQRIAVARSLYRNPFVIVFDEATSALDPFTEAQLTLAIEAVSVSRTVVVVAHRLDTVRRCDRLLLFADGEIIDSGSYEELHQRSSVFRELVHAEH